MKKWIVEKSTFCRKMGKIELKQNEIEHHFVQVTLLKMPKKCIHAPPLRPSLLKPSVRVRAIAGSIVTPGLELSW